MSYDLYIVCDEASVTALTEKGKDYMSGYLSLSDFKYKFCHLSSSDISQMAEDGMNIKLKL